jgi:acetoacetyl-CoA synthetase
VRGQMGARVLEDPERMPGTRWFPDAQLNLPRTCCAAGTTVMRWFSGAKTGSRTVFPMGTCIVRWPILRRRSRNMGVVAGDRVAAWMPNLPETIVVMLAASSIGAIFSSASPDFGVQGVLDRFGQIEPKVLVAVDGYYYNGKVVDCLDRLAAITEGLPSVKRVVVVPYVHAHHDMSHVHHARMLAGFRQAFPGGHRDSVCPAAFRHPAVHHVFVGHHRGAQVHRALCRRRALLQHLKGASPAR